jgi:hypothetical protein
VTNTAPFIEYDAADRRDVQVAILVCPRFAPVDIIGLHTIFGLLPGAQVHLVWKNLDDIVGMPVFPTRATTTFTGAAFNEVVVAAVDRATQRLEATTSAA